MPQNERSHISVTNFGWTVTLGHTDQPSAVFELGRVEPLRASSSSYHDHAQAAPPSDVQLTLPSMKNLSENWVSDGMDAVLLIGSQISRIPDNYDPVEMGGLWRVLGLVNADEKNLTGYTLRVHISIYWGMYLMRLYRCRVGSGEAHKLLPRHPCATDGSERSNKPWTEGEYYLPPQDTFQQALRLAGTQMPCPPLLEPGNA